MPAHQGMSLQSCTLKDTGTSERRVPAHSRGSLAGRADSQCSIRLTEAWRDALTFTLMTDRDPIREQMARYTKMLLLPCFGATEKIKYRITPKAVVQ